MMNCGYIAQTYSTSWAVPVTIRDLSHCYWTLIVIEVHVHWYNVIYMYMFPGPLFITLYGTLSRADCTCFLDSNVVKILFYYNLSCWSVTNLILACF